MEDRKFENTDSESDSEKIDTFDDMMNAFADKKSECGLPISRFADKFKKKDVKIPNQKNPHTERCLWSYYYRLFQGS